MTVEEIERRGAAHVRADGRHGSRDERSRLGERGRAAACEGGDEAADDAWAKQQVRPKMPLADEEVLQYATFECSTAPSNFRHYKNVFMDGYARHHKPDLDLTPAGGGITYLKWAATMMRMNKERQSRPQGGQGTKQQTQARKGKYKKGRGKNRERQKETGA